MKPLSLRPFLLIFFSLQSVALIADDLISHEETGIIFPREIAGLEIGEKNVFDQKALGESVSFFSDEATATVYLYNRGREDLKDDPKHDTIVGELSAALGEIKRAEEFGIYEKVEFSDSARQSGKEGSFTFLSMPVSFDQVLDFETREPIERQRNESLIGVGLFQGFFLKLRYSIDGGENLEEQERIRDEFVGDLVTLILMVEIRPQVEEWLVQYMADPLSEKGQDVLGGIFAYAEKSPLIQISIDRDVAPWMGVDDYPYSSELLGAYVAGQVAAQLKAKNFENDEEAGMEQVLKVYRLLKAKDEGALLEALEGELGAGN